MYALSLLSTGLAGETVKHWYWVRFKFLFSNKQARLTGMITLSVSIFIAAIGLFLYNDYRKNVDRELNRPHIELLQINLDVTNRAFRKYDEHAAKLSFHPAVLEYVTAPLGRKKDAAAALAADLIPDALRDDIHSVYIVDVPNQRLAASGEVSESEIEAYGDVTWANRIDELRSKPLLIQRRTMGRPDVRTQLTTELISIYRPILINDRLAGTVIVNLDYDRFFTTIYSQIKNPQYIYNLDNELIYPKRSEHFSTDAMASAIETLGVRPFGEVKLDGRAYLANQAFSDVTGWRWISLVPLDDLLKNARLVRTIVILLSLASILIGCAAIWYYSYTAFRPLKRISQMLASASGEKQALHDEARTDIQTVESYIRKISKEISAFAAVAQVSLPELRAKYVPDVLFRRIGTKEALEKWNSYFHDWSHEPLFGAIVSIDGYEEWRSRYNEEDQLLFKYALTNLVGECLAPRWRNIIVPLDKENMFVLLQPKEPFHHVEPYIQEDFENTIRAASSYLNIGVSVGIGSCRHAITELHETYEEAKHALLFRLYEGYGRAIRYAPQASTERFDVPREEWGEKLRGAIESLDSDRYASAIGQWSAWVRAHRVNPEEVYVFVDELVSELHDGLERRQFPVPDLFAEYTEHRLRMLDAHDIASLLLRIAEGIEAAVKQRIGRKEYNQVQRMVQFMEEHLHENIGLQEIADAVQLSTSSVSNIFKQETGYSTYEYLTKIRIDKAAELLTGTSLRIAEIAASVGYQNENSFIRSFRKAKSVTPGKFREMHRAN